MKKILCIVLLVLLVNCSTTNTPSNTPKDENKSSIGNIVDVLKNIPFPKF